eukprot:TRINITY_DN11815_c0_g1_i1.p1 TRINITY_DN11815_c0_g1~~TRINITY_DN11815_c0_g1_i1.p1  ORF type:complete len:468 (+),score=237.75 TRINITY_DN11815_c0_g1_i1:120-1406(+)
MVLGAAASNKLSFGDEALKGELVSKCEALQMYCVVNRPKKSWVSQSPVTRVERGGGSGAKRSPSKKDVSSLVFTPYPRTHYDALRLPPPWLSDRIVLPKDKALVKRAKVANELLATETGYVRDLGILIGLYLKPLQCDYEGLVEAYEINSLFKNIEQLYEVNVVLLEKLTAEVMKPDAEQMIGSVFLEMMEELRKYNSYSANNQAGVETLDKLMATNPQFAAMCAEAKRQPESRKLDLGGFITKPFQRICRYPLLLREIRELTPNDWDDYAALEEALQKLNETVQGANETKRVTDDLYKVVQIQNRFTSLTAELAQLHKMKYCSEYVCKTIVKNRLKKAEVFLFSGAFILAKPKGSKLSVVVTIPATALAVEEVSDAKLFKYGVTVRSTAKSGDTCVVVFKTDEERQQKMAEIMSVNARALAEQSETA